MENSLSKNKLIKFIMGSTSIITLRPANIDGQTEATKITIFTMKANNKCSFSSALCELLLCGAMSEKQNIGFRKLEN